MISDFNMETEDTNMETQSLLRDELYNLKVVNLAGEFDPETTYKVAALKERKRSAKTSLTNSFSTRLMLEAILEENDRLTVTEADEKLKSTLRELKNCKTEVGKTEASIISLCEAADNAFVLIKSRITEIEKNMETLEKKKTTLEELKAKHNKFKKASPNKQNRIQEIHTLIQTCQDEINQGNKEIRKYEMAISRVQDRLSIIDYSNEETVNMVDMNKINRYNSLNNSIEKMGDVKVVILSENKIQLEFTGSLETDTYDNAKLILNVTFKSDLLNYNVIDSAEVNILSLDVSDIINNSVKQNDLNGLVSQLKTRWLSHVPLLTEINTLQQRFAIDWIQDEGLLRVMVGKGGSVVCTLSIPTTYPLQGLIILLDIKGCTIDATDIQGQTDCKTLQQWVEYLENKFGKP